MNIMDLFEDIKNKKLKPLYILVGEEIGVIDIYLEQIKNIDDFIVADSLASIYNDVFGKTLIPSGKGYIVRNDTDFTKSTKYKEVLERIADNENKTVILVYSNLKKNTKFYKDTEPYRIEFEKLSTEQLVRQLGKETKASAKIIKEVCHYVSNDYLRAKAELGNLQTLCEVNGIDYDQALDIYYEYLTVEETFDVMKVVDAMLAKDYDYVSDAFRVMKAEGVNSLGMLTLLHNAYKAMYCVIDNGGVANVEQNTGTPYWLANKVSALIKPKGYTKASTLKLMTIVRETEVGIKQGKIPEEIALDYVFLMGVSYGRV